MLARRLAVSRSLVAVTETGTPPTETLITRLYEVFPERETEITAAAQRWAKPHARNPRHLPRQKAIQAKIDALITSKKLREARDHLTHEIKSVKNHDIDYFVWLFEQLGWVEDLRNDLDASRTALANGIQMAWLMRGRDNKPCFLVEQLAISYMQDEKYAHAHKLLDLRIANASNPASAWYNNGIIHWDEGNLSNAYSALTTGLRYKDRRLDIQGARGHILAEWGHPEEAIADLNEVLESPQLPLSVAVRVRSARAYAFFQRQKSPQDRPGGWREMVDLAITELDHAEADMAVSPWPYYFRGLCSKLHYDMLCTSDHKSTDDVSRAITNSRDNMRSDFECAVQYGYPDLDQHTKYGYPGLNRHTVRTMKDALTASVEFPRFRGHLNAVSSDTAERMSSHVYQSWRETWISA